MKVFIGRPLNSAPRTDARREGRRSMPGAGIGWRGSNRSRTRFVLLGSIAWAKEDESRIPDLSCPVNSRSALNREQGLATDLAPAVLFSERASIEPRSDVPRPISVRARLDLRHQARQEAKPGPVCRLKLRAARVDLHLPSEGRPCPEKGKAPIRESRTTPPIRLLTQAPITNSSLDSLVCSTDARAHSSFQLKPLRRHANRQQRRPFSKESHFRYWNGWLEARARGRVETIRTTEKMPLGRPATWNYDVYYLVIK